MPEAIRSDALATITLRALSICDMMGGRRVDGATEAQLLERGFTFRGPRTYAVYAAMVALGKVIPDSRAPIMKPLPVNDPLLKEASDASAYNFSPDRWDQPRQGKIAALKKTEGGVEVSFKKETWMQPDYECYDLPTVYWSSVDGRYKHDWDCKKVGQHPESSQEPPHVISAPAAEGLKIGQVLVLRGGGPQGKRVGFPLESRIPEKGAAKVAKKGADNIVPRGFVMPTTGKLEVLYGVAVK
jgi:hypothetical protein